MTLTTRSELLAAYAAGETSPGLSLLCAAQTSIDASSVAFVTMAEEIAGAALRGDAPPPLAAMDREAMLARLDEPETAAETVSAPPPGASAPGSPFPSVLRDALGGDVGDIAWRFRMPGLHEHILAGFEGEKVSLLSARPGVRVPQHTHRGMEATLVLQGELKDDDGVLRRGDVSICTDAHDHQPEIVGAETCYCLIVVDGGLRFTGTFGPALNLFQSSRPRGAKR